jgi:hypothetical protein
MREKALSLPALACTHTHMQREDIQPIITSMDHLSANGTEQMALIIITLRFNSACSTHVTDQIQPSIAYYQEHLPRFIRKTDQIIFSGSSIYILLPKAQLSGAELVQNRLWDAMLWRIHNASEQNMLQPSFMSSGHSAYPRPSAEVLACVQAAEEIQLHFEIQAEKPVQTKDDASYILARQLGIPYLSLLPRTLSPRMLQIVRPELAQELRCYPVGRARDTLTIAMSDPRDEQALTRLEQETGLHIFPVVVSPQELQTALEQFVY